MTDTYTVDDYRNAARRALEAGNTAAAEELAQAGIALSQQQPQGTDLGAPQAAPENVVATTPNGGRIIERNGQRSFVSPAYSTTDPARIAQIMEGATPADAYQSGLFESMIQQHPVAARGATAFQGVPFVGSRLDEAASTMFGPQAGQAVRFSQRAMEQTRPGQTTALRAGGTAAGIIPMLLGGAAAPIAQGSTLGARMITGALAGATAGGVEGAIYGSGDQSGAGRAANARNNAVWGAALGAPLGAAVPALDRGLAAVLERLRGRPAPQIARELGTSVEAAIVINRALQAGNMDEALQALMRQGDNAMLADAGQGARGLLDAAAQSGGNANAIAREAVDGRVGVQYQALTEALDATLGAPQGQTTLRANIRTQSAPERRALYDAAYSQPIDYSQPSARRLESLLARVPDGAIQRANQMMREAGEESGQIIARIADDGSVTFAEMPDVRQIHYVMQGLDDLIAQQNARGALGGATTQGRIRSNLRSDISTVLRDLVPDFATAQDRFADLARQSEAADLGYSLLRPGTTRDIAGRALDGASESELSAARQGLREYIEDQLANTRRLASDPNLDAREALSAARLMTSRRAQANIRLLLRSDESERLFGALDEALGGLELRAAIARNSGTAIRGSIQESVAGLTAPSALEALLDAQPMTAGRQVLRAITGSSEEAEALRRMGLFEEITRVLTDTRGPQAQRALRTVREIQHGGVITDSRADLVGRVLIHAGAETARQTTLQGLQVR